MAPRTKQFPDAIVPMTCACRHVPNFLETRENKYLIGRSSGQAFSKASSNGRNGSTEVTGENFATRCSWVASQDPDDFFLGSRTSLASLFQKLGKLVYLVQAQIRQWRIVKPTTFKNKKIQKGTSVRSHPELNSRNPWNPHKKYDVPIHFATQQ